MKGNSFNKTNRKTKPNWEKALFSIDSFVTNYFQQHREDQEKFECLICQSKKSAYSSGLIKNIVTHIESEKHKRILGDEKLNNQLLEAITKIKYGAQEDNISEHEDLVQGSVDYLQFEIAKFLVENRIPFKLVDQLIPFIQHIYTSYGPSTVNSCDMSRTTVTKLVNHCINGSIKQEILKDLTHSPYSLAMDETTDAFGSSYMAICARYLPLKDPEVFSSHKEPVTKLISIIKLKESKTAAAIYAKIKEEILSQDPRLIDNLMGIVTDQGSNMVGRNKGLGTLMKEDVPHLVHFHDLSHIYNLICKKSIEVYPQSVYNCVTEICSHFNHSSIRMEKLKIIQKEQGFEHLFEILSFVPTRWLSLLECINRIIKLWGPLRKYYQDEVDYDSDKYFGPKNELYVRTLGILLDKIAYYNKLFQHDTLYYDKVKEAIIESFKIFAKVVLSSTKYPSIIFQQVIDVDYNSNLESLGDIIVDDEDLLKYWTETYPNLQDIVIKLSKNDLKEFLGSNKKFLLKILAEMKKRLPFKEQIFKDCEPIFKPVPFNKANWRKLGDTFTNIITKERLEKFKFELERFETNEEAITEGMKSFGGTPLELWQRLLTDYTCMKDLATALLMLPHSSCPVERIFSQMKDFKTTKRNRLKVEHLEACLLIQQRFKGKFEITEDMMKRRADMWKQEEVEKNNEDGRTTPLVDPLNKLSIEENSNHSELTLSSQRIPQRQSSYKDIIVDGVMEEEKLQTTFDAIDIHEETASSKLLYEATSLNLRKRKPNLPLTTKNMNAQTTIEAKNKKKFISLSNTNSCD